MAIYYVVDTPEELRDSIVEELTNKLELVEHRVVTYRQAVDNGGKIPGVISGVRKRDLDAARTEAGVIRQWLLHLREAHIVTKAQNPIKGG